MTDEELMEQALDALRLCTALPTWPSITPVIEALRARLSKPGDPIDTSAGHVDELAKHEHISSPAELRRRTNTPWDDKASY